MKKGSNVKVNGYLINNGERINLKITPEEMLDNGANTELAADDINSFTASIENQYLLLEYYLLSHHIPMRSIEEFKTVEKYSEYLYGLVCDNGYIILQEIQPIQNPEQQTRWTLSTKAKDRYASAEHTFYMHVPEDLDKLDDKTKAYLKSHREEYENAYTYLFIEKKKRDTYKAERSYSLDSVYNDLNVGDKKTR